MTGPAATLAKGAIQVMFVRKMKMVAAGLLAAAILSGAGITISRQMDSVKAAEKSSFGSDEPGQQRKNPSATSDDQPPSKPPVVQIAQPIVRSVTDYLIFNGRLQASSTVAIRPRVSGTLAGVMFREGTEVQQGQLLFEIDPRSYQSEIDKARADLVVAESQLRLADSTLKRMRSLSDKSAIGPELLDKATADRTASEGAVLRAKATVEKAQHNLDLTRVTSPIRGQIGRRLVDPGNVVKADETLLAEVFNGEIMYVYGEIDERSFMQVRTLIDRTKDNGKQLSVGVGLISEDGFHREGIVDFIDNRLNPATSTATVRIVVANKDKKLVPGMTARIRLAVNEPHEALLVPPNAIRSEGGKKYVFVVDAKNTVEKRTVSIGQGHDDLLAIKDGLKTEDHVVVGYPYELRSGMIVEPRSATTDKR
jgi:RND family efflux transporter MFP subunit